MAHAIDFMIFVRPGKELVEPATAWRQICAILFTAHENCRYLHLRHCVQNLLLPGVVQEPRRRLPSMTIVVDHRISELCIAEALRKLVELRIRQMKSRGPFTPKSSQKFAGAAFD